MKIVIAPDSFKESLSAYEVAEAVKKGFIDVFPNAEFCLLPIADGGEGTVDAIIYALNGEKIDLEVTNPLGKSDNAFYGLCNDKVLQNTTCAIIEMAAASGLEKVPVHQRNAKIATSYGTGELIKDALDKGVTKFIIGLGGSATNDAGAGMLQALGVKLLDKNDDQIGYGGQSLADLVKIDISEMDPRLAMCDIQVACDVSNPLTGPNGASAIFGPQKGASPADVIELDNNLKHFANILKRDLGKDIENLAGAGAAGGLGVGLVAFFNASLRPGIEIVTDLLNIEYIIEDADLIITGEGRLDSQSLNGKVPVGIANIAKKHHKPVIVIAGSLGEQLETVYQHGISAVFSILSKITTLEEALNSDEAKKNIHNTARNIAAVFKIGISNKKM